MEGQELLENDESKTRGTDTKDKPISGTDLWPGLLSKLKSWTTFKRYRRLSAPEDTDDDQQLECASAQVLPKNEITYADVPIHDQERLILEVEVQKHSRERISSNDQDQKQQDNNFTAELKPRSVEDNLILVDEEQIEEQFAEEMFEDDDKNSMPEKDVPFNENNENAGILEDSPAFCAKMESQLPVKDEAKTQDIDTKDKLSFKSWTPIERQSRLSSEEDTDDDEQSESISDNILKDDIEIPGDTRFSAELEIQSKETISARDQEQHDINSAVFPEENDPKDNEIPNKQMTRIVGKDLTRTKGELPKLKIGQKDYDNKPDSSEFHMMQHADLHEEFDKVEDSELQANEKPVDKNYQPEKTNVEIVNEESIPVKKETSITDRIQEGIRRMRLFGRSKSIDLSDDEHIVNKETVGLNSSLKSSIKTNVADTYQPNEAVLKSMESGDTPSIELKLQTVEYNLIKQEDDQIEERPKGEVAEEVLSDVMFNDIDKEPVPQEVVTYEASEILEERCLSQMLVDAVLCFILILYVGWREIRKTF